MYMCYLLRDLWTEELEAMFALCETEIWTVLLGDWCYLTKP